jgi:hypothetical protein
MISRLVLVGLVAALGVTFPGKTDCQAWFDAFQTWASARLADWDTEDSRHDQPHLDSQIYMRDRLRLTQRAERPMLSSPDNPTTEPRTRALVPAVRWKTARVPRAAGIARALEPRASRIAFTPISVELDAAVAFAYTLNRLSEGFDAPPTTMTSLTSNEDSAPPCSCDHLECQLLADLWWLSEHAHGAPANATATASPPLTKNAKSRRADPWGRDFHVFGALAANPAADDPASLRARRLREESPLIESPTDRGWEIADALNRLGEGIDIDPAREPARPARSPGFALIEVATELESDTANALNRAAEGLTLDPSGSDTAATAETDRPVAQVATLAPAPEIGAPSHIERAESNSPFEHPFAELPADDHPQRDITLGHAIRLTCEAAYAWMDVLAGSARVTMTSR